MRHQVLEVLLYALTATGIALRTWVEVLAWYRDRRANLRRERLAAHIAEEDRLHPPPSVDPALCQARRLELLASGWRESFPGVFTLAMHPMERRALHVSANERCSVIRELRCRSSL